MQKPLVILIADDETPARDELRYTLTEFLPDSTYHEATNGRQALEIIGQEPIQVVFLDINMPELDGLSTAAALLEMPAPPLIIFATAYDEHALRAFELAALDYVVKPFDERRLARTVERIRGTLQAQDQVEAQHQLLRAYLDETLPTRQPTRLWAERENENRVLVDYEQIGWVEAVEKKVYLATVAGEKLLVRQTLKELEPQLTPQHFVRVHKGYLVNLDHVTEVIPWFSGGYLMRMDDAEQTEVPVSRRYAAQLKKKIGLY